MVIAINKWDNMTDMIVSNANLMLIAVLTLFLGRNSFISALHGTGVGIYIHPFTVLMNRQT